MHISYKFRKKCYPPKDEDLDLRKSGLEKIFETILMLIVYNWVPIKHQQDQLSPEELKKASRADLNASGQIIYIYTSSIRYIHDIHSV